MQLHIINSNSSGNAYILENNQESLLIECGVRFPRIQQAYHFNPKKIVGCLVSHEHMDHCFAVKEIMGAGIMVYASPGTHEAMGTTGHHRAYVLLSGQMIEIGGFRVLGFEIKHDAAQPYGFLIWHKDSGLTLFLTDSYYSEYTFPGLNNIIIEANYCQKILDKRVKDGFNPKFLRDRVITSHMSLSTCKDLLKANDLSAVNNIVLIHLSDGNSDAMRFKDEVEEATGKNVYVADAGMTIEKFNKQPF